MDIKDVNKLKGELQLNTSKGFGYFFKNILMLILILIFVFILTNPTLITNPEDFLINFNSKSLWVLLILFLSICGFYQLSRNIDEQNRNSRILNDMDIAFERNKEKESKQHADLVVKRFQVSQDIDSELKSLLINLNADRAAVLEMHNGTYNSSGLPFIYADMTYEQISPNVHFARDEFKNFNLAKLQFVSKHYNEKIWVGSVNDVAKDDAYFSAKLTTVEVSYGAFMRLEGPHGELGLLTLFYKNEEDHESKTKIIAEITHSAQIISALLDATKE